MKPTEFWVLMTDETTPCLVSKSEHNFDELLESNPDWKVVRVEVKDEDA
jgi:hypothetical protein